MTVTMKRLTIGFVLALMALLGTPALAGPNPANVPSGEAELDKLDDIAVYLVGPRFIPSRSELRKIDGDPVPELLKIASDRRKKPFVRERAIRCMSLYPDARVRQGFSAMLSEGPNRYFGLVVMAYLEAFGEDVVADVKPFLTHRKSSVRATVVKGLGIFGGQEGYDLLVALEKSEDDAGVQAQIRSYIQ
jgi:hypothetical protein